MIKPRIVIIGGGFGGLTMAKTLRKADVSVTLLDKRNHHLFQPLLYQVATGGLSPANIAASLRAVIGRNKNTEILLAEVVGFDPTRNRVLLRDGEIEYDYLIVAAGASNNYFGHDEWEAHAPSLKSLEEALDMRKRILLALEAAERERDPVIQQQYLRFVVIGGGPTGVELAGAVAEVVYSTLRREFRHFQPSHVEVHLVEGGPRILPPYSEKLSRKAEKALATLGVNVHTSTMVEDIRPGEVIVTENGQRAVLKARVVLWGAGVRGNPLGERLAETTGVELDRGKRVMIDPQLRIPNHPNIFVIGDLAYSLGPDGKPLPGMAQVAMQQGAYVARLILDEGKDRPAAPFRYKDKGMMATIGRGRAVVSAGRIQISGYLAWLMWLFIHLLYIVAFESRILVLFQWAWNYLTRNRSSLLITGSVPPLKSETGEAAGDSE